MAPSLQLFYGPLMIGVFLNCILYGVLIVQTFLYFQTYKKDAASFRLFVVYLFILETINTACDMILLYEPLIIQFGQPHAEMFFPIMLAASPVLTVAMSTPIQIFTAWRISVIARSRPMAIVICILAVMSFAGGIWTTIRVADYRLLSRKPDLNESALLWFISSGLADMLITGSLIFSLSRRRTGHESTDISINRIIRLTIQTGAVTMIFALIDLMTFLISPTTAINFVWDFALSKLYTNALLSTLNARSGWTNLGTNSDPDNVLFGKNTSLGTAQIGRATAGATVSAVELDTHQASIGSYELQSRTVKVTNPQTSQLRINVTKHVEQDEPVYTAQ
ncbi:hypothetical protein JB92DRAFT_638881 [Gautieria morchelliformis]|nr:hypothetical protein JB92DRAFT_638881 [Gautieria morchelliformis]